MIDSSQRRFSRGGPFKQKPKRRVGPIQVMNTRMNFLGRGENNHKVLERKGSDPVTKVRISWAVTWKMRKTVSLGKSWIT